MIKRIHHIGIVVTSLDETLRLFESIFGLKATIVNDVMDGKARMALIPVGDDEMELVQPIDPDTRIGRVLRTRGQGIYHISFSTDDIESEMARMKEKGVLFDEQKPRIGGHGLRIASTKPETTGGLMIELTEERER